MFCVVVYLVFGRSVGKDANIGIVSVRQDAHMLLFEGRGKKIGGPEDIRLVRGPCIVWVAVQAVNEDDAMHKRC
jgi:hypothetical protein